MGITYSDPDVDTDADIADIAALTPANGDLLQFSSDGSRYNGVQPGALTVTSTGGTSKTLAAWMQDVAESDTAFLTPEDYGAVGDVVSYASGGAIASGSTTFTGAGFTSSHVGKRIIIQGAGAAGVPHEAAIATYVNATQVTLSVAASTTVTSAEYAYGTDDSAAFVLMEAARVAMQPGAVCVLRPVIYGLSNAAIQTRSQSNEINDGWICVGGKATLKAIRTVDNDYLVATDRWIDGATWPAFSGTPFTFANIRFDGSNIVDWPEVCKGYEWKHFDCEWANGRVGQAKQTRQNQYNEVIRVTANVTSGSPTLTNVTFVSSTGAAVSLAGIKLRQLIDGTGFVASTSNSPYITAIDTGAGTLTISQNANATATGATFYINRNGAGNRYQAECYWMDGQFRSGDGCTYLFKNEGTVESDIDASTDGWFMNNVVNGEDVATYGMWFGNTGGWHIKGQHSYSNGYDMWVAALGYNHVIDGNEFEDWVYIRDVYGKNELGPGNTFWEGLEIGFSDDTTTEELTIAAPRFTQFRGGGAYAQIKVNTARANKSVYVPIPHFRAGQTANSTNPVNIVNLGTVTLDGGVDGDGFIGRRVYRNDATGVTQVTLHDSASPAASDVIWSLTNQGRNSAAAIKNYASEEVQISDATSTSEDAKRVFRQMIGGTLTQVFALEPYAYQSIAGGSAVGYYAAGEGDTAFELKRHGSSAADAATLRGYRARATIGSPASVQQFDETLRITAGGYSSGAFRDAGYIHHYMFAATPSSTDMEGQWRIEACAAGSASITEIARFSHANGFAMFGANTVVDAARGIRSVSYTSTQLNDITNAVNTANKAAGKMVWNSTASKPVWAVGSTAGSVWVDGAGTTVNTPV